MNKIIKNLGEKILLVEDEPAVRKAASAWLERNGYVVLVAVDASEAHEIFDRQAEEIGLVFSDLVMPGENGLELVSDLRRRKPGLGAIIASGYGWETADLADIEEQGIIFMQKPYVLAELLVVIGEILDR